MRDIQSVLKYLDILNIEKSYIDVLTIIGRKIQVIEKENSKRDIFVDFIHCYLIYFLEPFRGLLSEAENLSKFMQYQMVTATEQDIILKNNDGKIDEILVMKVVLESLNFTLEFENTSSDAYDELYDGLFNAVSILGAKIQS